MLELTRLIVEMSADAVFVINPDGRFLYVNDASCRYLGYSRDELSRLMVSDLDPNFPANTWVQHWQQGRAMGSRTFESFHRASDGHLIPVEITSNHIKFGEQEYHCTFVRDITARKNAEQHERSSNQAMKLLVKGAPLAEVLETIALGIEAERSEMLCTIKLLDVNGNLLVVSAAPSLSDFYRNAIDKRPIGIGIGSCGHAAYTKERTIVEDIRTHPNWVAYKDLAIQEGMGACWSQPILNASGNVLGTFGVYFHTPRTPDEKDLKLIENYAHLAAIAIESRQFEEELRLASSILQSSSEGMLVTDESNQIIAINPAFSKITGYNFDEVKGKNPRIFSSGKHDQAYYRAMWHELITTGHWQGEIWDKRKNGEFYAKWLTINIIPNKDGSVHRYVALFSDITEKKKSEELIWKQANFDTLTGLPNREMFRDRLAQEVKKAERANLPLALLLIDLDKFKDVNDTLGHDMGDILLQEAARRIRVCVRESDTVARLGGDEFTVILTELSDNSHLEDIAQIIISMLAEPYLLGSEVVYVSASIGITLYPNDTNDIDVLLKNADQAMYVAKNKGRNRSSYFTQSLQQAAQTRMQLINDLRGALIANQFRVYYQPIVDLGTGRIHKAEALIRWLHPMRGLISPMEFIPLAEETGLIVEIGDWVFNESARQVSHWRKSFNAELQISVNWSPVQFYNSASRANNLSCLDYLKELRLPGQSMVFEITERLLLDAQPSVTDILLKFRDAEIQVAIDDFGTGYSSLSYLKKFDIDYLKIDKSFVDHLETDANNMALCEAIIVMAHKLGLKVIAEGVETKEQRNILIAASCDYAQGYLYSRPIPPDMFEALFNSPTLVDV